MSKYTGKDILRSTTNT